MSEYTALARADGRPVTRFARAPVADALATAVVVLIVAAPMLFTSSGFALDFTNHLWLAWAAGKALVENGHPSFYLNTTGLGVFYPFYAFYGGTLYAATGAVAELLAGHVILAYTGVTMMGVASAYGGTLWIARQLGVRGWIAHAPALTVVTSAYYIADLYGRGAWPELMATSALALLAASALHLVRAPAWRPLPILTFVASAVIFTGSHNITLLWGTTVAVLAALVMWLALGAPRQLPYRRLAMIGGLGVASAMVNAWFLFPDLAYERYVAISHEVTVVWSSTSFLDTPAVLLDPFRNVPAVSGTPTLFVQMPDWFLAWGLAAGGFAVWRGRVNSTLRRAWAGVATLIALLAVMLMVGDFWEIVPFPFDQIQFPYRLNSYLFYAIAGLVLVGVLAVQRAGAEGPRSSSARGLRVALVGASLVSAGLCVWQLWVPNTRVEKSYVNRAEVLSSVNVLPSSWYDGGSYRDALAPEVAAQPERTLFIEPAAVHGERFAAMMNAPAGPAPIATNIKGGSYLARISGGVEKVGDGPGGEAIVKRVNGGNGPVEVVVEDPRGTAVKLGQLTSIVALLAILAVLIRAMLAGRAQRTGKGELDITQRPATAD
jgi:hypothetical protein